MSSLASEPVDLDLVTACEQRIVNAWPAPTTMLIGDWVVRMANGYSGRANSASPVRAGADLDGPAFELIERLFRAQGLAPCIRVTPLAAAGLRARIDARGYRFKDGSFGMITPAAAVPMPEGLVIEAEPVEDWIQSISRFQVPAKRNPVHLAAIVGNIRMKAGFATLHDAGQARAFGMCVVERGMAEIGAVMVDEAVRGRGLGRQLVSGLMAWAAANGAQSAYLQVDRSNSVAINLYRSMGYRVAYAYDTLLLS